MIGHFDLDAIKHAAACAGEKRTVKVVHKQTGRSLEVNTRTEWYGNWRDKSGGKLAQINKQKGTEFQWDDFEYEDIQTPEPIENIMHSAKLMVQKAVELSKADKVYYYIGKGESMRLERSTLLKYKGQRENLIKAVYLDEVSDYLKNKFSAELVTHREVDDAVVMGSYGKKNHFVIGAEKDFLGCGSNFFNFRKPELGLMNTNCFGSLWLNDKNEVTGIGRMFKLFQCCSIDSADNYAANCMSSTRWGAKSAYNALKDCKDDKELFQASVGVFKKLYPEPKTVTGWRGDGIEIDWLYVFQECFDMCHLHRKENDWIDVKEILEKYKIE
ncbi:hypothetical protein D3C85_378150 [compost metagenome]